MSEYIDESRLPRYDYVIGGRRLNLTPDNSILVGYPNDYTYSHIRTIITRKHNGTLGYGSIFRNADGFAEAYEFMRNHGYPYTEVLDPVNEAVIVAKSLVLKSPNQIMELDPELLKTEYLPDSWDLARAKFYHDQTGHLAEKPLPSQHEAGIQLGRVVFDIASTPEALHMWGLKN